MSEKCFCHFNGYQVKDATARAGIEALDQRVEGNEESIRDLYDKTIHYFDSLEAAEAANLPEGSFVAVPSEGGGGGLPVVRLTTTIQNGATLTSEESALLTAAFAQYMENGPNIAFRFNKLDLGTMVLAPFFANPMVGIDQSLGIAYFAISFGSFVVMILTPFMDISTGTATWSVLMQNV